MKAEKYRKEKKNAKQKVNKFRKKRNNAEKCENLAENYLLEFQKAWNVFLKEAGAVWRQKSTEKRRNMQKELAVGRYCYDSEASNSKSEVLKAMKVTLAEKGQNYLRFNAKIIFVA